MKEYQRLKNNKYLLPHAVYIQTLWKIRDYYRLKEVSDELIYGSGGLDGMPRCKELNDKTSKVAEKRERYIKDISLIDNELKLIPCEYQKGVWNSIMFGERYPEDAHRATYSEHKSKFIFSVAHRFGLI